MGRDRSRINFEYGDNTDLREYINAISSKNGIKKEEVILDLLRKAMDTRENIKRPLDSEIYMKNEEMLANYKEQADKLKNETELEISNNFLANVLTQYYNFTCLEVTSADPLKSKPKLWHLVKLDKVVGKSHYGSPVTSKRLTRAEGEREIERLNKLDEYELEEVDIETIADLLEKGRPRDTTKR
jgi:hypothetical protein